ncbi:Putative NADH-flavin reductase [Paraoerskovia marina]|uniref:Putative NADH-flavin reductase n=1 Tax=Paraoerskovia marina TaxID=545619 RepID=A0A1H1NY08_9CELL|nr:SDR family oxidoreductase [Paraoerskovia marina]SDS03871.1 Putative NADH-flavin reductase [Paraoerskovia marina]
MAKIALIGAHGKVGQLAIPELVDRGHEVSGVIRSEDQSESIEKLGATPLVLDVAGASFERMVEAFRGHDAVVWSAGAGGKGGAETTYAVDRDAAIRSMDAAKGAGVGRYVMVSFIGAVPNHGVPETDSFYPYTDAKVTADLHLRDSELDWTILGPGALTEDEATGQIAVYGEDSELPGNDEMGTSRGNVALTIAEALASPASIGQFIRYTDGGTPIGAALSH